MPTINHREDMQKPIIAHRFLILILVCVLCTTYYVPVYGQSAKITVPSDVHTMTMTFDPQGSAPVNPEEGQMYFNSSSGQLFYYAHDATWKSFGAGSGSQDAAVATKIVAASNSLGAYKADYVCDGTDDQVEINAALSDISASGGAVYLLEGTYNLSGGGLGCGQSAPTNSIMICNVGKPRALIGSGRATVLKAVASDISVIKVKKISLVAGSVENILISQLTIDGNNLAQSGINMSDAAYCKIDKVRISNIRSGLNGDAAIESTSASSLGHHNTISNCFIQNNQCSGIVSSDSYDIIYNNTIFSTGESAGIALSSNSADVDGYSIVGNNYLRNNTTGISISDSPGNVIISNTIEDNALDGINISSAVGNAIFGNSFQGNSGRAIYLTDSSESNIFSNNIQSNIGSGIYLNSSSDNNICANVIYGNGVLGGGNQDPIYLAAGDRNMISSNRVFSSFAFSGTVYGINISGGSDNYVGANFLHDSNFFGSSFDVRLKNTGTATRFSGNNKIGIDQGNYTVSTGTLTPGSTSYIRISPSVSISSIAAGNCSGQLLIIEGAANGITLSGGAALKMHVSPLILNTNDILSLIWDGARWVEVEYKDNSP